MIIPECQGSIRFAIDAVVAALVVGNIGVVVVAAVDTNVSSKNRSNIKSALSACLNRLSKERLRFVVQWIQCCIFDGSKQLLVTGIQMKGWKFTVVAFGTVGVFGFVIVVVLSI